ncbi:segregation/condensation protein A [Streptomyces sp. KR80]|uniref:segregation/condensation protein A n=1 Tax=Streptomyces sp. KR80 TaxID=3457426 RepID=UPI003FD1F719
MPTDDAPAPQSRRRALGRGPGTTPLAAGAVAAEGPVPLAEDDLSGRDGRSVPGDEPAASRQSAAVGDAPLPTAVERNDPVPAAPPLAAEADAAGSPAGGESGDAPRHGSAGETGTADRPGRSAAHDVEEDGRVSQATDAASAGQPAPAGHVAATERGAADGDSPAVQDQQMGQLVGGDDAEVGVRQGPGDGIDAGSRGGPQAGDAGRRGGGEGEDAGGRFTVRLANFEGPFDLLLQLISKHKLDVTEVALSKVTDEFMAHIRAMGPDWDLDQTTEFLVVAATLLDLKAARLLPAAEVEDEADLALLEARDLLFARLLQYRAYKQIAEIFNDRLAAEARRHPRTVGLEPHHAELLPEVAISIGAEGFAKLAVKAMRPKPKPQVYVDHIHAPLVSVREQAAVVIARLREAGEASFQALTEDAADTLTVVARFLALLELYRERAVVLDQEEALGSLMVRWTGGEDRQPMVTDEFDQVPGERAEEAEKAEEMEKA